jgi:hypothetical protein
VWDLLTVRSGAAVGIVTIVTSLAELPGDPPPNTYTWFVNGEVANGDTFTVTVIAG